jgi:hypothetical protein
MWQHGSDGRPAYTRSLFQLRYSVPIMITGNGVVHNIATQAEFAAWVATVFEGDVDYGFARQLAVE